MLPPPLVIPPEEPPSAELEAGVEGFSPDRLLQQTEKSPPPGATSISTPSLLQPPLPPLPPLPPPPSLRRVYRRCCSSHPTEKKQQSRKQYTGCIGSVLRCGCCLFAAGVAILIAYWSLSPLCTNCHGAVWSSISGSSSSAVEIAAMESSSAGDGVQPFSTLRINQLQVRGASVLYTADRCCHDNS